MLSPISWMGSKWRLAKRIIAMMPQHRTYVEPFGGSGAVLFRNDQPEAVEYLNDINPDLFNFYTVLKTYPNELQERLTGVRFSIERFRAASIRVGDPLADAASFFIRCRLSYNGIIADGFNSYRHITKRGEQSTFDRRVAALPLYAARLRHVHLTGSHFRDALAGQDRPGVVVYADPCYFPSTRTSGRKYVCEMSAADHVELLAILNRFRRASVILSGYDCEVYRSALSHWRRRSVPVSVGLSGSRVRRVEMLWTNF